jgi:hypothetical protein
MRTVYKYEDRIDVFGSNLAGVHGAGHAKDVKNYFYAKVGVGEGMTGQAYALPTKDHTIKTRTLDQVSESLNKFLLFAAENEKKQFFMARVGCGLAGFKDADIIGLLNAHESIPENIVLPGTWHNKVRGGKLLRLVIAGGREFDDQEMLFEKTDESLAKALDAGFNIEIVSGTARGADAMAIDYAKSRGFDWAEFPAPWTEFKERFGYNKTAGMMRNRWMAHFSMALLAFHDGKSPGTKGMIQLATGENLKVKVEKYGLDNHVQMDMDI